MGWRDVAWLGARKLGVKQLLVAVGAREQEGSEQSLSTSHMPDTTVDISHILSHVNRNTRGTLLLSWHKRGNRDSESKVGELRFDSKILDGQIHVLTPQVCHTTSRNSANTTCSYTSVFFCLWALWMELLFSHFCHFQAFQYKETITPVAPSSPILTAASEVIGCIFQLLGSNVNFWLDLSFPFFLWWRVIVLCFSSTLGPCLGFTESHF